RLPRRERRGDPPGRPPRRGRRVRRGLAGRLPDRAGRARDAAVTGPAAEDRAGAGVPAGRADTAPGRARRPPGPGERAPDRGRRRGRAGRAHRHPDHPPPGPGRERRPRHPPGPGGGGGGRPPPRIRCPALGGGAPGNRGPRRPLLRLLRLARPLRARLLLSVLAGAAATGCGVALLAVSGFLLARASEHPGIVAISVAVVAVRGLSAGRGGFRYLGPLTSHDVAVRVLR